jgi:hypothetical protein
MGNDYDIGYGKPPEHTQFKPGESGNPKGRPKKAKSGSTDVDQLLSEPITVRQEGVKRKILPFEAAVRRLVSRALKDCNLPAVNEFIRLCEKYEVMMPPSLPEVGGVLHIPKTWDEYEWMQMLKKHGRPPWPGSRSGLPE